MLPSFSLLFYAACSFLINKITSHLVPVNVNIMIDIVTVRLKRPQYKCGDLEQYRTGIGTILEQARHNSNLLVKNALLSQPYVGVLETSYPLLTRQYEHEPQLTVGFGVHYVMKIYVRLQNKPSSGKSILS